jgi:SAM-dependent methyltransferase
MTKTVQPPPESGTPPADASTPHPDEPMDLDEDAAAEWAITEFTGEVATEPGDKTDGLAQKAALAAEQVFRWIEPGAGPSEAAPPMPGEGDDFSRRDTPPPVPVGALIPARDNGAAVAEPFGLVEHGALPPEPADAGRTPAGSDEVIILETVPLPPRAAAVPDASLPAPAVAEPPPAGNEAARPATVRVPTPPPLPAAAHAAAAASLLLPNLPVELTGAAPGAWPEALAQRPRKKRLRPWFEEVFDEDYLRTLPFMTAEQTLREVAFIREALAPPADGQILDIACGYGRHAIELSQRGLRVTGLDLSLPLLIRAADESQRRSLSVNFVHADMREMAFDGQFDGAYCILSSFGYFDEETNLKVATAICRSLKPGARFLLDTLNRDYIVADLPARVWWEGDGCVVLEEVDFNFHTSRVIIRRSVVFADGRQVEQDISIRAYSLHELGKLLRQAGFRVQDVSGSLATKGHFFGATSRNIIMVCERPTG